MNVLESIHTSLTEIRSHKLRSFLTLVGIILAPPHWWSWCP